MSWLSEGLKKIGVPVPKTPTVIKKIGDVAAGVVLNNVPGGNLVKQGIDAVGSAAKKLSLGGLSSQVAAGVTQDVKSGVQQAQNAAAVKGAADTAGLGLQVLFSSPVGLALVVVVVVLLVRRR